MASLKPGECAGRAVSECLSYPSSWVAPGMARRGRKQPAYRPSSQRPVRNGTKSADASHLKCGRKTPSLGLWSLGLGKRSATPRPSRLVNPFQRGPASSEVLSSQRNAMVTWVAFCWPRAPRSRATVRSYRGNHSSVGVIRLRMGTDPGPWGLALNSLRSGLPAAATTKNTNATQTAPEMASRDRFGLSSTVGSVERHSHVLAARSEQDQEPTLLTDMKTATEAETEAETEADTHRSRSGLWSTESKSGTASAEHRPVETTEEPCLFQEPWQRLGNDHCVWPRDPDTPADNPGVVLLPQEPEAMSTASATTRRRPRARLVLLDRWLDPITPLVTPVTIHGLEYERGHAPCWQRWNWTEPRPAEEVQSWLLEQERKTSACSILQMESTGKRLSEAEQAKLHQRIQTICQEPFFKATSDIGAWAQALKRFSDARPDPNAADMAQVADYVRALQRHQAEQRLVSELLLRAQQLSADTFDHVYFRELLALERELLRGEAERRIGTETFAKRLEQILAAVVVAPSGSWLGDRSLFWRLIVLHGFCTGSDDFLERHTSLFHIAACCYGIDRLRSDWRALVESDLVAQITRKIRGTRHGVGLLAPANFDWPLARDALQLNHVDSNVTDAYAGYLPLSAALAVLACDGKRSPWQFPTSPLKHASPGDDNNTENEPQQVQTSSAGELNRSLLILRQTPNLLRPIQPRHWHHGPFRELCQRALGCHKGPMTRAISMPHSEETLSLTPVGKRENATPEWILVIGGCSPVEAECLASAVAQSRGASCPVQVLTTGVHSSREWLLLTLHGDDSTLWDRQSVS
ncbi:hypothetical protein F1559_000169 [Cyanidiococcus yangmingshanensis]|uniref:Uncharacterized protein n=1 Tax=Cyanidiococcus yangmingshanensis TaxID=2690220 RepID=A0A7J7ICI0_9RHOD|nr:hypothetical protein F1559_000169 [Cyanidiococcus yangmingshanensis]